MRTDITFDAGGLKLAGWLYKPKGKGPHPLVILSHGFTGLKAMGLAGYAEIFEKAGLACLVYDHRNWGESEGEPRMEINPWDQVHDMRDAVTHARSLPGIDKERIGIWGTSYSGGHVLVVGAIDRRVKCVVSQVPLVTGYGTMNRWVTSAAMAGMQERFIQDRDDRAAGKPPRLVKAAFPGTETEEWVQATDKDGSYPNQVTQRSLEMMLEYEPASYIHRIAPTPLMMIVAKRDTQTPTDTQLEAFNRACDPKQLVLLDCRHYDPYTAMLKESAHAARDWFLAHLA